jgi:hypothetical protein
MNKFIIRNDDVGFDTELEEIKRFCEICDKYGFQIIQAITPIGLSGRRARSAMNNEDIKLLSFNRFDENQEVVEFLLKRRDIIGVHGLWHTHEPTIKEIKKGKEILQSLGFNPTYFVPPFNEGDYEPEVEGLITSKLSMENGDLLELYLHEGTPTAPIMYLHSWRFNHVKYKWKHLEQCLSRLSAK